MNGLVIRNTGYWYTVLVDGDGGTVDCKVKGNFRLRGIRSTNPVAVGDRVSVTAAGDDGTAWITEIADRRNCIIRKASNLSKQSSVIAANVDQVMLVVTVKHPETSLVFIDRFLASAEAYCVPVIIVFNKTDLLAEDDWRRLEQVQSLYRSIGYENLAVSAVRGDGMEGLKATLGGKTTLMSGNSGTGKSTIINAVIPEANLRTADISEAHDQGMHTTTFSEMLPLNAVAVSSGRDDGGWIIDTPGIKGFGTFDMKREELTSYFREIFHYSKECRFSDCTHTHEPNCAVLRAVQDGLISQSRYQSYLSMLEDENDTKYRAPY